MKRMNSLRVAILVGLTASGLLGCTSYPWLGVLGDTVAATTTTSNGVFGTGPGDVFVGNLIQERTFVDGTSVETQTYRVDDISRTPLFIDFNSDGQLDPVVGYGGSQGVIQILLSRGQTGVVNPISLTLDSKRDMEDLADVAVGDIDNDGALDIVGGASGAVWYFHHPTGLPTTELRAWGNLDPTDDLRERVDASHQEFTQAELLAIITQAVGPGVNLDDYIITIEQLYRNVELGDFDLDGDNDIAASRSFKISLQPRPEAPVEPIDIIDGDVFVFQNPGFAIDGNGWANFSIGRHERQQRLDRDGASGLKAIDMDGDGDLDLVTSAREDNNAQVAWFENPGALNASLPWTQWRIGSVRDAWSIDVRDLTEDGRPDVVATGGAQKQMMLFVQPDDGPKRSYDWDSFVITTFESFEPRDVKIVDIDRDGQFELALGGTLGALRFFERPLLDPRGIWQANVIANIEPAGDVGLLGFGDLDGDSDADLIVVQSGTEENDARLLWIRNDLAR